MYNCEKQIGRVLEKISAEKQTYLSEILLIDNLSQDNTIQVAIEAGKHIDIPLKVIKNKQNISLGGSHKVAFNYCLKNKIDYCIVCHGDDQGNIQDITPVVEFAIDQKYDAYLGARFHKKSVLIGYSKFRVFGNYLVNFVMSLATRRRIKDIGSGLNMYSTSMLKSKHYMCFPNSLNFNVFMLLYSIWKKHKLYFFQISWGEDDQVSNARVMRQGLQILKLTALFTVAPKLIFNKLKSDPEISYDDYTHVFSNKV